MAVMTLATVLFAGMREMGFVGFWVGIVPHMDVPIWIKPPLWGLMFVIEVISHFARVLSLTVRLYANMFAGDLVTLPVVYARRRGDGWATHWGDMGEKKPPPPPTDTSPSASGVVPASRVEKNGLAETGKEIGKPLPSVKE